MGFVHIQSIFSVQVFQLGENTYSWYALEKPFKTQSLPMKQSCSCHISVSAQNKQVHFTGTPVNLPINSM